MIGGFLARVVARRRRHGDGRNFWMARRGSRGFTVIEVLIVLAVTGMLFVSAAILIAGRRQQAEFNQAIRQIQSQIQQVINEVAIGYYPNAGNFQCTVTGGNPPNIQPGTAEQGTNSDCIFMGKVMQFKVADTSPEQFKTYTIVGRRLSAVNPGAEAGSRATALPVVVDPTIPNTVGTGLLQSGLTTTSMVWGAADVPTGAVAFSQSLAQYSDGQIQSGSQKVDVIPIRNATLDATVDQAVQQINDNYVTSVINPSSGVQLCFVSGGTNQSGLISIGGEQRQLTVSLEIKSNKTCS